MKISRLTLAVGMGALVFALAPAQVLAQPAPKTITRDVTFTSHDGYPMVGRLTLPDTRGLHPVLMLVQTAEAATMDGARKLLDRSPSC